jgi:predicted phosphoribosyltransferase
MTELLQETPLASLWNATKASTCKIIVAVPVLPYDTLAVFEKNTDEFVYLIASKDFRGVGRFYEDFQQVEDDEVRCWKLRIRLRK